MVIFDWVWNGDWDVVEIFVCSKQIPFLTFFIWRWPGIRFCAHINITIDQAPVVRKVDSAIRSINLYQMDKAISFQNTDCFYWIAVSSFWTTGAGFVCGPFSFAHHAQFKWTKYLEETQLLTLVSTCSQSWELKWSRADIKSATRTMDTMHNGCN